MTTVTYCDVDECQANDQKNAVRTVAQRCGVPAKKPNPIKKQGESDAKKDS